MTRVSTRVPVEPKSATTSAYPSVIRKAVPVMKKAFWMIMWAVAVLFAADMLHMDTTKPGVVFGSLIVGAVLGLALTWGDGSKQES